MAANPHSSDTDRPPMESKTTPAKLARLAKIGGVSEGGLSARHVERPSLPLLVAPSTSKDTFNAIRVPLETIACWRLNDARFGFDSSFIHPEAQEEFAALGALLDQLEDAPLSVFGHADPTGSDEYNKKLSGRRAQAVYAVLVRRTDLWEALYAQPFGGDDWEASHWLDLMFESLGYDVHDRADVQRFQDDHGCAPDGVVGPETRRALFKAYMAMLCTREGTEPLLLDADRFLGAGTMPGGKADYQGCSDFNTVLIPSASEDAELKKPQNKTRRDDVHSTNRRVLVFAFPPGTSIAPGDWPCPTAAASGEGCRAHFWPDAAKRRAPSADRRTFAKQRDTFACRFYHRLAMRSPCERLVGARRVTVNLVDPFGHVLPQHPCGLLVGEKLDAAKDTITDEAGNVAAVVPEGPVGVLLPDGRFGVLRGSDLQYEFARHRSDPGAGAEHVTSAPRSQEDDAWNAILEAVDDLHGRYADTTPTDLDLTKDA